jgi:signal transduction histidine kinase/CheY-like chemotaxis protein
MPPHPRLSSFRTSFQFKLLLIFTLSTFLIFSLLCALYIVTEIRHTRDEATRRLLLRAQNLADSVRLPLYAGNTAALTRLAVQAAQAPEIVAVVISASDGKVLVDFHTSTASSPTETISQTVEVRSNPLTDTPESYLTGGMDNQSAMLGTVRMERGTADITRNINQVLLISIFAALGFWVAVSVLCNLVLSRLTSSYNALLHGIELMQGGDFNSRIGVKYDDDAGRASHAVNELAASLQKRGEENIRLHEERLNLERQMLQAQKLESLGIMAGGIAHDFNNLLQSILGNMELASKNITPGSEPQKLIDNALKSGRQAAHLTSLILTYTGRGLITKKEMDLNELIKDNADMLKMVVSSEISLELFLPAGLPAIMADEAGIQQVVMNLILNGAESIEEKHGFVRITTGVQICDQTCLAASLLEEKPEPGQFLIMEVRDNGCGMSEETVKRLFDPFFTTKFTGRGLGMSAVMGIMKSHGGALFVESEVGKGTTFRVLFPVTESAWAVTEREAINPPEMRDAQEMQLSGLVLVVDDEKNVLKTCTKMVKLCGFEVITACDGFDAVAKFREHADEIDVVLMDLTMPNMGGIEAMGEIYGIRGDARVILSSGFNKEELSGRIAGQPPSGFIRKPYSMAELETELRRVMRGE